MRNHQNSFSLLLIKGLKTDGDSRRTRFFLDLVLLALLLFLLPLLPTEEDVFLLLAVLRLPVQSEDLDHHHRHSEKHQFLYASGRLGCGVFG